MKTQKIHSPNTMNLFVEKFTRIATSLLFIVFTIGLSAQTKSGNSTGSFKGLTGDGTSPGNPVQISTLAELRIVSEDPEFRDKHLALVADIDATDTKNWNVDDHDNDDETPEVAMGFIPIGYYHSEPTRFSGSFEGNGHTISNLYIYHQKSSGDHAGLFGSVQTDWYIKNVNVTNVNFTCKYGGGLISNIHKGYVKNCHTSGTVTGTWGFLGGLIGSASHMVNNKSIDIDNCSSSCDVIGDASNSVGYLGGLIGRAYAYGHDGEYLSISNCSASGDIFSNGDYIGGLLGIAHDSILISNCFATGDVTGLTSCGGLIGYCTGKGSEVKTAQVINCYSTGNVSAVSDTENITSLRRFGGFIGNLGDNVLIDECRTLADTVMANNAQEVGGFIGTYNANGGHSLLINSYSEIKYVKGKEYVGGFLGDGAGTGFSKLTIKNCYTKSNVNASDTDNAYAGGFAGGGPDYLFNCVSYGNVKSTGDQVGGFIGRGRGVKVESCYSYAEVVEGNSSVGGFIGLDYTDTLLNCHAMVKVVNGNENVGGFLGKGSPDLNSGCSTRAKVIANGDNVGGYAGNMSSSNSKTLIRCSATGNVQSTGEKYTGGFIGNAGSIKIQECFATGNVVGNQYVGGLCGMSEDILQCFATGNATGTKYVGGLCGRSYNIENSFATGNVSTDSYGGSIAGYWSKVINSYGTGSVNGTGELIGGGFGGSNSGSKKCYFDATVNPELNGNGDGKYPEECIGLTTPQFANASNFETWDFTNIWQIGIIKWISTYERPYLKWQLEDGQNSPINSMRIENQKSETLISPDQTLVKIAMPYGSDVSNLALIFELTNGAILIINDSIQVSGVSMNDFSSPVMCYIVYPNTKSGLLTSEQNTQDTVLWIIEVENQAHVLTYSTAEESGVLKGRNEQIVLNNGISDPVEAIPNQGYRFVHWENAGGDILTTDSILVIDSVSKSEIFTAIFEIETGISDVKNNAINCYPNPTKGPLKIEFEKYYTGYIEVISIAGEVLKKVEVKSELSKIIEISSIKTGIYFIKVGNRNIKIMKQ